MTVSAALTPARAHKYARPAGSGFRERGPSPPMIASSAKNWPSFNPFRMRTVAARGLLVRTASDARAPSASSTAGIPSYARVYSRSLVS